MASYTTNLNLKKPAGSENVAIGDINNNMDTIDQAYGTLNSKIGMKSKPFSGTNCVYRFGNMCYLTIQEGTFSNTGAYTVIKASDNSYNLTMPSGYKPIGQVVLVDALADKRLYIQPGGDVTCADSISAVSLRFSACWITSDAMPS